MNFSVDNLIGLGGGLSLTFFSISGAKCINSPEDKQKGCSKTNMNLGLGIMGTTGALMVYKHLRA
jgi:hypothetical protein